MKKLVVPPTNIKDCFNNYKIMQEEGPSTHAVLETIHWVYEHRYESDNLCKAAKIKPIQISDLVWGLIEMARNICMEGEKKKMEEELKELRDQTETMLGNLVQEMGNMLSVLKTAQRTAFAFSLNNEEDIRKMHRLAFSLYNNWKNESRPTILGLTSFK